MAFALLSLVPLILSNLGGYLSSRAAYRDLVRENIEKTARVQAFELEDFLARQQSHLELAAVSGRRWPTLLREGSLPRESREIVEEGLAATLERAESIESMLLLAPDRTVLASAGDPWPSGPLYCELPAPGESRFARLLNTSEESLRVVVSVPVLGADGRPAGALCSRVGFGVHEQLLGERASSFVNGIAYIVDQSGNVVCGSYHDDEPHIAPGHDLEPGLVEIAREGVAWSGVVDDHHAGPTYAAYAPAGGLPWGVVVEVPVSVATAPMESLKRRGLLFGIVLTLTLVGFVTILARRLVQPLHALVGAAGRIAGGRYGDKVPVRGDDELTRLAEEFNRMSAALLESYQVLDTRVAERTRDLEESRDFVDLILDSMDHRILVLDRDLKIVRANRAARAAYGEDLERRACHEVFDDPAAPCADCPARRTLERDLPGSVERSDAKRGEVLAVDTFPVPSREGPPGAVIQVIRVVTEEKALQAQLVHQEKMAAIGQLAAGLAHEIGNPLASISSELQMLELQPEQVTDNRSVRVLRQQVDRVARLLRQLTDFSRKDRDLAGPVSVVEVAQDVLQLLRHDRRSRGVSIEAHLDADIPAVWATRDQLIQVLLNLCLNALDALGETGGLEVSVAGRPGEVVVVVDDQGPGISPAVRERIFEPFFTTKPPGMGTGLGLFVTRRIVQDLGGSIQVETATGRGARFEVVLPAWTEVP